MWCHCWWRKEIKVMYWHRVMMHQTSLLLWRCLITMGWAGANSTPLVYILSWHTDHAYNISNRVYQSGQLPRYGPRFILKSWAESLPCMSVVHAWCLFMHDPLLKWPPSTTMHNFYSLWLSSQLTVNHHGLSWYSLETRSCTWASIYVVFVPDLQVALHSLSC